MPVIDTQCWVGNGLRIQQTVEDLLRQMDQWDVERAVVRTVDQFVAVYNREGNNQILQAVKAHPDRLIGLTVANPWYGKAAVGELTRCYEAGLRGLWLDTRTHGCFLTDSIVLDLVARADQLKLPVFAHCGTPLYSFPLSLMELALQFPETQFVLGSVGYADGWNDVLPATREAKNISVETSHGSMQILRAVIRELGPERVLFGSDYPVGSMAAELQKMNLLDVEESSRAMMMQSNALSILGIGS